MLNFLPPAIARWPLTLVAAAGPLAFFGIPDVIALVCLVVDTRRNGKVNRVFLAGTAAADCLASAAIDDRIQRTVGAAGRLAGVLIRMGRRFV